VSALRDSSDWQSFCLRPFHFSRSNQKARRDNLLLTIQAYRVAWSLFSL